MHNEKGVALVWVIIVLIIVVVFSTAIIRLIDQNVFEINLLNKEARLYYVAESGVEIGYTALMAEYPNLGDRFIESFAKDMTPVTHRQDIVDGGKTLGKVVVTISVVAIDGRDWFEIKSIGTLKDDTVELTRIMRIEYNNHQNILKYTE